MNTGENKQIKLTWHGHSCFSLDYQNYCLVFDPYADNYINGLSPLKLTANQVICSHQHNDHNFAAAVKLSENNKICPFSIEYITCAHDEAGGSKRGMNQIALLKSDNYRIAHFGDIGCMLNDEQKAKLKNLDIALLPIGGIYTITAKEADDICKELAPKVVIPMHYRSENFGLSELDTVDSFVKIRSDAVFYNGNIFIYDKNTAAQTAVLKLK